jgi:hypothetical protein
VIAAERVPSTSLAAFKQPSVEIRMPTPSRLPQPVPAYLYITTQVASELLGTDVGGARPGASGKSFRGDPRFVATPARYPTRNVVAVLRGSDPALRSEYVAIGAHSDHVGTADSALPHDSVFVVNRLFRRQGAETAAPTLSDIDVERVNSELAQIRATTKGKSAFPDSIFNGADDDGSGSVALLELAEYFAGQRVRPKRSLLFVWHAGEEAGLQGSTLFTNAPTVVREKIVAQLNMDMIGRGGAGDVTGVTREGAPIHGGPGYLQLVGSRRLSTELGDLVETLNQRPEHQLRLDYSIDADGHPQNIYCRSDHYAYARFGIPIVFFTTGGHSEYHQLTDEPQYIDYHHLARVAGLVRDVTREVANLDHRVVVDKPKPDPDGPCRQ